MSRPAIRRVYTIRLTASEQADLDDAATRVSRGGLAHVGPRALAANLVVAGVKKILEIPLDASATA